MCPKTKEQFEEIREASSNKILMAALELFGTHGYHATSVSQVAARAKVSKGLIYNYFESKERILEALFIQLGQRENEIFKQVQDSDPAKMVENILRYFFDEIRNNADLWKLITSLAIEVGKFEFIHEPVTTKLHSYYALFEDLLNRIGIEHPDKEAKLITGLLDGIGIQAIVLGNQYPLEEVEEYLISKYCKK